MSKIILAILSFAFLAFGCQRRPTGERFIQPQVLIKAIGLPDTLSPPDVVELTAENLPKPIEIKPRTLPLKYPYGIGKPTVKSFGLEDGLTTEMVLDLALDQNGKLWIAGVGFFGSFDGTTFTPYHSFETGSLLINDLFIDSKGLIWIISADGVFTFDGELFTKIPLGDKERRLVGSGVLEDSWGSIWIGTNQGIFQIEGETITNHGEAGEFRCRLFTTPEGRIIFSGEKNLYIETQQHLPIPQIPEHAEIHFVSKEGVIWFSYLKERIRKVAKLERDQVEVFGEAEGISPTEFIREITADRSGKIWITGSENIYQFADSKVIKIPNQEYGIAFPGSMLEDEFGNFWIGSNSGLHKLSLAYQNLLESPLQKDGKETILSDIAIDSKGSRWASSSRNKLILYQEKQALVWDLEPIMGQLLVIMISLDVEDNLWILTSGPVSQGKLIRFDGTHFYTYDPKEFLHLDLIMQIGQGPFGSLAFSGEGGITFFDGKKFSHFGPKQGYPQHATGYLVDSNGINWIGTSDNGAVGVKEDSILHIGVVEGLGNMYVNEIEEDPYGNLWIANDGGLSKFDGQTLTNYGLLDGIGAVVGTIARSEKDSIMWFGSSLGLSKVHYNDLDSSQIEFTTYSKSNGFELVPNLILINAVIEVDSMGLWASDLTKGIVRFDPTTLEDKKPPVLEIKNIRVNNSPVVWSLIHGKEGDELDRKKIRNESFLKFGKELGFRDFWIQLDEFGGIEFDSLSKFGNIPINLILPYSSNTLTFEFSTISPSFGKHNKYRYFLEGFNRRWSPFSSLGEVNFSNIPEGEYTLQLEALTSYGAINKLSYTFQVLPPWYRSWWAYLIYFFAFAAIVRWIYSFQKKRLITREKEKAREKELAQAKEIEKAYTELKSTQAQLIQSEKMASLGELTAGIAHEIQNPLNFVNNFSEVSNELLDEMNEELTKGDLDEVKTIASELKENLSKINHHGKRAGSIVKGMLEHSRKSDGKKELTDINRLADESLRLSFHGLRAKDKEFQSSFKLDLDPDLPEIEVIPQDIGRVLLNLINNAFYACAERSRSTGNGKAKNSGEDYQPKVIVSTRKTESGIELSVADNGSGIPDSIKEKIFQPFFTTKPTGQGTGLGLSLSYDIVKAHGGRIEVKSEANQGTEFIIYFPI